MLAAFFGQEAHWADLGVVGLLVLLEGVLSIDNALVLSLLAKRLPKFQQARALNYGLVGAFVFRFMAIAMASYLLRWRIVKLLGGGYLIYIAGKQLLFDSKNKADGELKLGPDGKPILVDPETKAPLETTDESSELQQRVPVPLPADVQQRGGTARFWPTVGMLALTDIAFAVDSILAAIALVGSPPPGHPPDAVHPKLWVVLSGGLLGIILMRIAAGIFIRLLEKYPRFEVAAYLLVAVTGGKLIADWACNTAEHPHLLNFHDWHHLEFWVFWALMILSFSVGFIRPKSERTVKAKEPALPK